MRIEVEIPDEQAAWIAALAVAVSGGGGATWGEPDPLETHGRVALVLRSLAHHAADGVRRPGAWERSWISQVFPGEAVAVAVPPPSAFRPAWPDTVKAIRDILAELAADGVSERAVAHGARVLRITPRDTKGLDVLVSLVNGCAGSARDAFRASLANGAPMAGKLDARTVQRAIDWLAAYDAAAGAA